MIHHPPSSFRHTSGAALLAVLWVIALLLGLVAGASLLLTQDLDAAAAKRQVFRARMLAETGLALAMNPGMQPDDPLLRRQINDDEQYEVQMTGEDGLLNPNILLQNEDRETFRRIFKTWGLELSKADGIIDCLLDWVDQDEFKHINGAEAKHYGNDGRPFNRPFRSIEEMSLVRGMDLVERANPDWRTWFSVLASGKLDVNEARPEIINTITGVSISTAQNLQRNRLGPDGIRNTQDDVRLDLPSAMVMLGIPTNSPFVNILSMDSPTKRIVVRVRVGDLEREVSAVVQGAIGQGATSILYLTEGNPPKNETTR
jgi:general secretion pathway protein K